MSTISGGIAAMNAAASFAGAQRSESDTDRNKEVAAERKFQVDRAAALANSVGDVADPDLSTDRDADGRLPWSAPANPDDASPEEREERAGNRRAGRCRDAFGERGNTLDVEA